MLTALGIRNIVLIDRLDLSFSHGLSVLTGETGAGKSILLDALGLALGARSEARLLRQGCERGSVSASFALGTGHPVTTLLKEHELPLGTDLVLRRVLTADGRTRAFVNDEPVGVSLLRRIGDMLVEIQGQFAEQGLLDATAHRHLLDAFGGLLPQREAVVQAYRDWKAKAAARATAESDADRARHDEAFLRHAMDELDKLAPEPGEETALAEKRSFLMNAETVVNALNASVAEIEGDGGGEARLRAAFVQIDKAAPKASGRLDAPLAALERALLETQEALAALQATASEIDLDGGDLDRIEERLFALREVARKHRVAVDDLPTLRQRIAERLDLLDDRSTELQRLRREEADAERRYRDAATALGQSRRDTAVRLDAAVNAELEPLRLGKATFSTEIEQLDERLWSEDGSDRVTFVVATNPGAAAGPLSKIASGGELSRFLLAIKVVLAELGSVPTLVFDEVDSGVGGAAADAVGERLNRLAEDIQVLVVTHSPQVAARGSTHLRVEKQEAGNIAVTTVACLGDEARREEIARMLSGQEITDEARAAASRLLEGERV